MAKPVDHNASPALVASSLTYPTHHIYHTPPTSTSLDATPHLLNHTFPITTHFIVHSLANSNAITVGAYIIAMLETGTPGLGLGGLFGEIETAFSKAFVFLC
jgi:hypothetical protein